MKLESKYSSKMLSPMKVESQRESSVAALMTQPYNMQESLNPALNRSDSARTKAKRGKASALCDPDSLDEPPSAATPRLLQSKSEVSGTRELKIDSIRQLPAFGNDNPEKQLEDQLNHELELQITDINDKRRSSQATQASQISKQSKQMNKPRHTQITKRVKEEQLNYELIKDIQISKSDEVVFAENEIAKQRQLPFLLKNEASQTSLNNLESSLKAFGILRNNQNLSKIMLNKDFKNTTGTTTLIKADQSPPKLNLDFLQNTKSSNIFENVMKQQCLRDLNDIRNADLSPENRAEPLQLTGFRSPVHVDKQQHIQNHKHQNKQNIQQYGRRTHISLLPTSLNDDLASPQFKLDAEHIDKVNQLLKQQRYNVDQIINEQSFDQFENSEDYFDNGHIENPNIHDHEESTRQLQKSVSVGTDDCQNDDHLGKQQTHRGTQKDITNNNTTTENKQTISKRQSRNRIPKKSRSPKEKRVVSRSSDTASLKSEKFVQNLKNLHRESATDIKVDQFAEDLPMVIFRDPQDQHKVPEHHRHLLSKKTTSSRLEEELQNFKKEQSEKKLISSQANISSIYQQQQQTQQDIQRREQQLLRTFENQTAHQIMKEKAQILTRNVYLRGHGALSSMKKIKNQSSLSESSKDLQYSRTQIDNSAQKIKDSAKISGHLSPGLEQQAYRASALQLNSPKPTQKQASNDLLMIQKSTIHIDSKSNRNGQSQFLQFQDGTKAYGYNKAGKRYNLNSDMMSPFQNPFDTPLNLAMHYGEFIQNEPIMRVQNGLQNQQETIHLQQNSGIRGSIQDKNIFTSAHADQQKPFLNHQNLQNQMDGHFYIQSLRNDTLPDTLRPTEHSKTNDNTRTIDQSNSISLSPLPVILNHNYRNQVNMQSLQNGISDINKLDVKIYKRSLQKSRLKFKKKQQHRQMRSTLVEQQGAEKDQKPEIQQHNEREKYFNIPTAEQEEINTHLTFENQEFDVTLKREEESLSRNFKTLTTGNNMGHSTDTLKNLINIDEGQAQQLKQVHQSKQNLKVASPNDSHYTQESVQANQKVDAKMDNAQLYESRFFVGNSSSKALDLPLEKSHDKVPSGAEKEKQPFGLPLIQMNRRAQYMHPYSVKNIQNNSVNFTNFSLINQSNNEITGFDHKQLESIDEGKFTLLSKARSKFNLAKLNQDSIEEQSKVESLRSSIADRLSMRMHDNAIVSTTTRRSHNSCSYQQMMQQNNRYQYQQQLKTNEKLYDLSLILPQIDKRISMERAQDLELLKVGGFRAKLARSPNPKDAKTQDRKVKVQENEEKPGSQLFQFAPNFATIDPYERRRRTKQYSSMVTQAKKTGGTSLNIVEDIVLNKDCDALSTIRSNAVEMNKIEHKFETKTQGSDDMAQTLAFQDPFNVYKSRLETINNQLHTVDINQIYNTGEDKETQAQRRTAFDLQFINKAINQGESRESGSADRYQHHQLRKTQARQTLGTQTVTMTSNSSKFISNHDMIQYFEAPTFKKGITK